jgi:hypothetical protein
MATWWLRFLSLGHRTNPPVPPTARKSILGFLGRTLGADMKSVASPNPDENTPTRRTKIRRATADWIRTAKVEILPANRVEGPSIKVSWARPAGTNPDEVQPS